MANQSTLAKGKLVAFIPTTDLIRARSFYQGVLGLPLVEEGNPFAIVFDANGTMLRVTAVQELHPDPFTILGWDVASIEETVRALTGAGVEFLRYPGVNDNDPLAIWTSPAGARVAWFKDPDGNVLSVTEFSS
jgi:catechol 2,3-dioxygenase-like lactoylglutathione lyase family enzyme